MAATRLLMRRLRELLRLASDSILVDAHHEIDGASHDAEMLALRSGALSTPSRSNKTAS